MRHACVRPRRTSGKSQMTEKHTLRSFDEALEVLSARILAMGEDVTRAVESAVGVYQTQDVDGAKRLVEQDLDIDRQHDGINAAVVDILARLHPVARDLREVLAAEHIAANLERVADHAKGIAKRSIANAAPSTSAGTSGMLGELCAGVVRSLREVLRALKDRDAALADWVRRGDGHLDQLYDDLFHMVIAGLRASPDTAPGDVQALFVGKSLERIGDHATNIAEEIRFMTKGVMPSATREV